jgi:hypothetical protein
MLADSARILDEDEEKDGKIERKELKTKEDIKNYVKGLM